MSGFARAAAVLLAAGVCVLPPAAGLGAQTFKAGVDLVHLPVVVLARDGGVVSGLTADDFEVLDGGQPQPILSFSEGPPGAAVPLHLGLMLDKSQSMELDAKLAADSVVRFIDAIPEAQDVTFVEFGASVRVSRFTPDSYLHLFTRIRERAADHSTALFDAIGRYVATTHERPGQHILLLYTDAGDSGRGLNAGQVQRLLREGNVLVYGVVYLENQASSERVRQRALMSQLTRETGGEAFFPSSSRDVADIYERIRAEIASRYTIGYAMPADAQDGRFRRVEVRVRGSRQDGVRVRTRSGYIANPR